jgi:uncharacterized protein (UPF0147 family)
MFEYFVEELAKASDRIKNAKRTKNPNAEMKAEDVHRALAQLLKDPSIPSSARKQLTQVHNDMKAKAEKEYALAATKRAGYVAGINPGQAAKDRAAKEAETQAVIDKHLETHEPKQIKELGHEKQYIEDTTNPKLRSKATEKLTGGVKQRLATGEGLAVRDKTFGQNLDLQRKLKEKEAQVRASKGPSEIIHIKANKGPEIPEEHVGDAVIGELTKLRGTLSHPDHLSAVDGEISNRIKDLSSGTMKKSVSESFAYNTGGQWFVKSK